MGADKQIKCSNKVQKAKKMQAKKQIECPHLVIRYLFHLVLPDTPNSHLERNLLVSLLLSGCSTHTNDGLWRNWCSGNGCWSYITDCRPRCLQHCVLESRGSSTSCRIRHMYHIYIAGRLRMLEEKWSEIWPPSRSNEVSWPFSKPGSE